MPQHRVLHERHALALGGVGDDHRRLPRGFGQIEKHIRQSLMIVTVHFTHGPVERPPLVDERLQRDRFRDRRQALYLVVVDDRHEVVQLVMLREKNGFPIRTFIAFTVREQRKHLLGAARHFQGVSHLHTHTQTMAQTAGGKFHSGNALVRDVPGQIRTVLVVRFELFNRKEPALRQRGIDSSAGVTFAQDEPICLASAVHQVARSRRCRKAQPICPRC